MYLIPDYLRAIEKEISMYQNLGCSIKTVFVGGGTPTVLNESELAGLFATIQSGFQIEEDAEITVEANPGTLNTEKLKTLKAFGVNRLSLGLQAYQLKLLKLMGRIHTPEDFKESFSKARNVGFDNINVDVIFGLPEQTLKDFKDTLEYLANISPEHISAYSLSIEEETPFYNMYKKGRLRLPNEDEERAMYHEAVDFLKSKGYLHYEISNFAKPAKQCRHNLTYWQDQEYLGLGAGAHSYINGIRYNNVKSPSEYIRLLYDDMSPVENREMITGQEEMAEYCFLNLRLIQGIDKQDFNRRFKKDIKELYGSTIDKLKLEGLLKENSRYISLTAIGLDLANEVFLEFLP